MVSLSDVFNIGSIVTGIIGGNREADHNQNVADYNWGQDVLNLGAFITDQLRTQENLVNQASIYDQTAQYHILNADFLRTQAGYYRSSSLERAQQLLDIRGAEIGVGRARADADMATIVASENTAHSQLAEVNTRRLALNNLYGARNQVLDATANNLHQQLQSLKTTTRANEAAIDIKLRALTSEGADLADITNARLKSIRFALVAIDAKRDLALSLIHI